jgi:hypothetical protein
LRATVGRACAWAGASGVSRASVTVSSLDAGAGQGELCGNWVVGQSEVNA